MDAKFQLDDIIHAGFNHGELRQSGVEATKLKGPPLCLTAVELYDAGYTISDLVSARFTIKDLKELLGIERDESPSLGSAVIVDLRVVCGGRALSPEELLTELFNARVPCSDLLVAGYTADELHDAGYMPRKIVESFQMNKDLSGLGSSTKMTKRQLKHVGATVKDLKGNDPAADVVELRKAGFSAAEMRAADFTMGQLYNNGGEGSFSLEQIREAWKEVKEKEQIRREDLTKFKEIPVEDLPRKLYDAGWSYEDLKEAGYETESLRGQTVSAQIIKLLNTPEALRGGVSIAGFKDLTTRYTPKQIRDEVHKFFGPEGKGGGAAGGSAASAEQETADQKTKWLCAKFKEAGYGGTPAEFSKLMEAYEPEELHGAGYTLTELLAYSDVTKLKCIFPLEALLPACKEVVTKGYRSIQDLTVADGFTAKELSSAHFTINELVAGECKPSDLIALASTNPANLLALQAIDPTEFKTAEFKVKQLLDDVKLDVSKLVKCFSLSDLVEGMRESSSFTKHLSALVNEDYNARTGRHAKELAKLPVTASELVEAGFKANALLIPEGPFPLTALKDRFTAGELLDANVEVSRLHTIGSLPGDFKSNTNLTVSDLIPTPKNLRSAGYSVKDLKDGGFSLSKLKDVLPVEDLLPHLSEAGYTAREAWAAGFTPRQLEQAYPILTLMESGISLSKLTAGTDTPAGSTPEQDVLRVGDLLPHLSVAGYTAREAWAAGFTPMQLKQAYPIPTLMESGISLKKLKAGLPVGDVGDLLPHLRRAGYTAMEARAAEFSCEEAQRANYTCTDVKQAGYTCAEAKLAGWGASIVKTEGYTLQDMKDAPFSLFEDLKPHCSAVQARGLGFQWSDLQSASYSAGEAREAGCSCKQAQEAGFISNAMEAKAAGYGLRDMKHAGIQRDDALRAFCPSLWNEPTLYVRHIWDEL